MLVSAPARVVTGAAVVAGAMVVTEAVVVAAQQANRESKLLSYLPHTCTPRHCYLDMRVSGMLVSAPAGVVTGAAVVAGAMVVTEAVVVAAQQANSESRLCAISHILYTHVIATLTCG